MKRRDGIRLSIVFVLVGLLLFMIVNKDYVIREHLTSGPPTLVTLQKDTEDLQNQITQLSNSVTQMKQQAQSQASQANAAKAQLSAAKMS